MALIFKDKGASVLDSDAERLTVSIKSLWTEFLDFRKFVQTGDYDLVRLSLKAMSLKARVCLLALCILFVNSISLPIEEETEKMRCKFFLHLIAILLPECSTV